MPFSPPPKIFIASLEALATRGAVVVDLGCGQGELGRLAADLGVGVIGIDRMPRPAGCATDLQADVRRLPLRSGAVDLLLAANLIPHLLAQDPRAGFLAGWVSTLVPGGRLLVMEDEPDCGAPARANYLDLQRFLARLDAGRRGPLVARDDFRHIVRSAGLPVRESWGFAQNEAIADVDRVLALLAPSGTVPQGEAGDLHRRIRKDGLEYGRCWWMMLERTG